MRNWLTPRRSQPFHASSAVSGGGAASRSSTVTSWSSLSGRLDHRYDLLSVIDAKLRPIPGPIRTLAGDVDGTLARWHDVRAHSALATQVAAANDVEGLARRLVATAAASPRLRNN